MSNSAWLIERYPAMSFALYRRYWLASLASVGGWQIANMAMGWRVFELSGKAVDLGVLGAASAIPAIVLTLLGGVIADRFEKRMVLICTTSVNALLLFLLAGLDYSGVLTVWQLWLLAGAISVVTGVDWPTRSSFFPNLVDRPALLSAVALNSVLWQITRMVLPGLGGLLLAVYETSLVFFLAGCGYLVMLVTMLRTSIRLPGDRDTSPVQQVIEGVRFVLADPLFRNLILLSYLTMLFLNSYAQLMPAFVKLLLAGPAGYGVLMSVTGFGSVAGTFVAGAYHFGSSYGRWMLIAAGLAAIALCCFGLTVMVPNYPLAVVFVFLAAMGSSVFLILSTAALQARVPDALRGRVMGIHSITYSVVPLGALFTGGLSAWMSTPAALLLTIVFYLLILAVVALRVPSVRNIQEPVVIEHRP